MGIKKTIEDALKEMIIPELNSLKNEISSVKGEVANLSVEQKATNKRLDDVNQHLENVNQHLVDQSRRIDAVREELTHNMNETNNRIDRLYEVIVRRDEHSELEHKVLELEKDVREIKLKMAG